MVFIFNKPYTLYCSEKCEGIILCLYETNCSGYLSLIIRNINHLTCNQKILFIHNWFVWFWLILQSLCNYMISLESLIQVKCLFILSISFCGHHITTTVMFTISNVPVNCHSIPQETCRFLSGRVLGINASLHGNHNLNGSKKRNPAEIGSPWHHRWTWHENLFLCHVTGSHHMN